MLGDVGLEPIVCSARLLEQGMTRRSTAIGSMAIISAMLVGACLENEPPTKGEAFWAGIKPVEVANGRAHRGPWLMNETDLDYVDDPTVAITDDGDIGVAWVDQDRQSVFFQMYSPADGPRLPNPVNVSSRPGTFSWLPRLVIATDDPRRVYVLWQEIVFSGGSHGGEIFFARSTDGGATFSTPVNLSNSVAGDGKGRLTAEHWDNGSLDLAAGPNGRLYAAWTEYEGRLWATRSADAGATFAEAILVDGDAIRPARAPALEVSGDGTLHLAWSAGSDAGAEIRIAASPDGQTFGAPQIVPSRGHADAPKIAADSQGNLHIVHGESPGGLFQDYRIRYARRDARSGRFSDSRTIAEADAGVDSVNFPDLAVDAATRLYVTWQLFPDRRQRPHGLGFTVSRDGGDTFAEPEVVPQSDSSDLGFSGSLQGSLMARLAVNAAGELALVGSTFAEGRSSHVWLWRRSAAAR